MCARRLSTTREKGEVEENDREATGIRPWRGVRRGVNHNQTALIYPLRSFNNYFVVPQAAVPQARPGEVRSEDMREAS